MMNLLFSCVLAASCVADFSPDYPPYPQGEVVDDYHGIKVTDPYRALEDNHASWLEKEKQVTDQYFSKIPFRKEITERLKTLYQFDSVSAPFTLGDNLLFLERGQNDIQAKLIICGKDLEDRENKEVLFDPKDLDAKGLLSISGVYPSFNGKYVAITLSKSGEDKSCIRVIRVKDKKLLDLEIKDVSYPTVAWSGNGFYYTGLTEHHRFDEKKKQKEMNDGEIRLDTTLVSPAVFYRSLTSKYDLLIYQNKESPDQFFSIESKLEGSYLILSITDSSSNGNALYYLTGSKRLKPLVSGYEHQVDLIDIIEGKAFVLRSNQIVSIDMQKPDNMKTIYQDPKKIIQNVSFESGFFFATYYENAKTAIGVIKKSGNMLHEIELPGIGVVSGFYGNLYYLYSSTLTPNDIYRYDFAEKKGELVYSTPYQFPFEEFETYQVFYESTDGIKIPMIITHKKGMKKEGNHPALLAGYGGFSISYIPRFSPSKLLFLEQGGIYAVANIRGGGEYGEPWHRAGMLENKQNVFEDFFSACEYLVEEKYTSKEILAVTGGSNGGLLMGAVITQRPDLCGAVVSRVGLYDMLRFHKFSIGWHWTAEYGSPDDPSQFTTLFQYSPLHNVNFSKFPAALILTGDHDDRVLPIHSYKFTAALQEKQQGEAPIFLKVFKNTGHGRGKPLDKILDEESLFWSFIFCNTTGKYHFFP